MEEPVEMRWYNPSAGEHEWRNVPKNDREALDFLEGYPEVETYAETYRYWRDLGLDIRGSLIRAGETARDADEITKDEGSD